MGREETPIGMELRREKGKGTREWYMKGLFGSLSFLSRDGYSRLA